MAAIVVERPTQYAGRVRERCTLLRRSERYYTEQGWSGAMVVDPAKANARWALPILKVMPGQRFEVLLGGGQWWFFGSHWIERQFLCTGQGCEGCVYAAPRVMGYRAALLLGGERRRACLLEAPLPSVSRLESLASMEGFCVGPGSRVSVTRKHRRAGLCLEAFSPDVEPVAERLTDQHTIGAVGVLFSLPTIDEGEAPKAWASRVERIAHARLVAAIAQSR